MGRSPSPPANVSDGRDERPIAPLSIETDLTVGLDGIEADVESTGERLLVEFRSVPNAIRAVRGQQAATEAWLPGLLTATDLTVEIRARGHILAVAGSKARPGVVSRLLSVDPVEIRIGGVVGGLTASASGTIGRLLDRIG